MNVWERAKEAMAAASRLAVYHSGNPAESYFLGVLAEMERVEWDEHIVTSGKHRGRKCIIVVLPEEDR